MSYLRAGGDGVYNIPALNASGQLYIRGKKFEDYIAELMSEDQLEQSEIDTLRTLLLHLKTDGLTSEWIVNNENKNAVLKTAITAIETKLAKIDTAALTETSVLTNDNRNSVLKTAIDTAASDLTALTGRVDTAEGNIVSLANRMTVAEGDIDGVETKTRFITEATITGTGDNTLSTYTTLVGPTTEEKGSTSMKLNVKNAGSELIGYEIKSNFNNDAYALNESTYSHRGGRLTLLGHTMRLQATEQIRIGNFAEYGDGFSTMAINIGGRGNKINIGRIDSQNATGGLTEINLGVLGGTGKRSTNTSIDGNVYLAGARFDDLTKTSRFTISSVLALMSSGPPSWVLGFFASATSIPFSDVWTMAPGTTSKSGDVATSNALMIEELYVVNKSITNITPKIGFFLAKANYSCTQLIGDHRTQVFEGEIVLRNNNITSSSVDWAFTGADDKCNVVNIGGDSGILIHQGASEDGATLQIINSCNGSIKMSLDNDGTKGSAKPALEVMPYDNDGTFQTMTRIGFYPGLYQGTGKVGSYQLEVNQELDRDGIAVAQTDIITGITVVNKINANSINTPGTITGIDLVGTTSISAPTATAGSLVINANYTGNTVARLYKNADNKLMWNGSEVGAGGVSSGGITYMINVASNISNPSPTPTVTIMTAAYSGNAQRTITQAVTANTAYYIAKYTTEVFDEVSNPVLTGLQQLNQYISWNSQNQVGQLYGQLWFQATAIGFGVLYQRTYASPVTTTAATFINGTPIPTPKGLYNIKFQRVLFPNINVVVTSGPVVLRYRVEGLVSGSWTSLYSMVGLVPPTVSSTTSNLTITLDESVILSQTTPGATAVRLVLFIGSGTGTISQTSAGGADLAAYRLIGLGEGTPGLFRTMLYDGTNAKITVPYSETPTLIEYDLAIDAPYNVSAFASPTLSTDLYFIQPAGGFANHAIALYFNEGSISHYHSTISPIQTTQTLAQVLNIGATASQAINMNTNKISGITTLEGAANGNWNVKEITAAQGSGISVSPTNGSYAIANSGIISISPGAGISVNTSASGVATITNTGIGTASVLENIRDEHQSLYEVGALPRKPDYWATNWSVADSTARSHQDIYVSVDGKIIATASGAGFAIRYSTNYGTSWNDGNVSASGLTWSSICGTSTGSKLFAFGRFIAQNQAQSLLLYSSINQGATWTQVTSSAFTGLSSVNRVRCSGDGKYILANITNVGTQGRSLFSSDGGATWVVKNISAGLPTGYTNGVAMSRSGAVQFITWINDTGTNSGIFRSMDYGATWGQMQAHIAGAKWTHIECDATGRFGWATRYLNINTQDSQAYRSEDYGATWFQAGMNSIEDIWVSGTGQFIAGVSVPNTAISNNGFLVYSVDYGRTIQAFSLGNTTTIRTINGSADGSVLVVGSVNFTEGGFAGDGLIRIARQGQQNIQDLQVSGGITLSKANGIYSLNVPTPTPPAEQLWYTGLTNTTNDVSTIYLDDFRAIAGKIDLNQYDIRYEMDINWKYTETTYPFAFVSLGLNSVQASAVANPTQNNAQTRWNNYLQPTFSSTATADQLYTSRFYCGYTATQGTGPTFRYRQTLCGKISLQTRTNPQTPIVLNDIAFNSRLITNDFVSNAVTLEQINTNQFRIYAGDSLDAGQQTIRGCAAWETSCDNLWNLGSSGGNDLNSGVFRLFLHFTDGTPTNRFRGAEVKYSIYRVNKGVVNSE
jgi:hypothetical protein